MSYADSVTQTSRDQAATNRYALRDLHEGLGAHKAQLKALFSAPPPGIIRQYVMPAELIFDGEIINSTAHLTVSPTDSLVDQVPGPVRTEYVYVDKVVFRANTSSAKELGDISEDEMSSDGPKDGKKSILHSVVRFTDLPGLEFTLPDLLHWLQLRVADFAHSEMREEVMEFAHLEQFVNWVNACLEIVYGDGSESSESLNGKGASQGTFAPEVEHDGSMGGPTRAASKSARSRWTVPMDGSSSKSSSLVSAGSAVDPGRWPQSLEDDILAQLSVSGVILDHSPRGSAEKVRAK